MAACLERHRDLTLLESDDGLTVHLDVEDLDALGPVDTPLDLPGLAGGRLIDVARCGMIERPDGTNAALDAERLAMVIDWLRALDPEGAVEAGVAAAS